MKKRLIHVGILVAVFIAAIVILSILTNKGNADMTAEMSAPTEPVVSFVSEGYVVNTLEGYKEEMDIPTMRDTLTPLSAMGETELKLQAYDQEVKSLTYTVYPLDGSEPYGEKSIKNPAETELLSVGEMLPEGEEGVLKVTLKTNKKIYYYTRIKRNQELHLKECLDFVQDFHQRTFNPELRETLEVYLEPATSEDNTNFHTVSINSDLDHITWGDLEPQIVGEVRWSIQESTETYSSVQLEYQVMCRGEINEQEQHRVKEFFRVRYVEGNLYLLNYNRTMNQVFDANKVVVTDKGIQLGVTDPDVEYMQNTDGTIVSFVQERELWCFNRQADQISQVFSFTGSESPDPRDLNDKHGINIIAVDDKGNTTFSVYGYMNRGDHEGEVGIAIYYFDLEKNCVEEKVFIPSNKSWDIAYDELGKMVYYNDKQEMLYVMIDGSLYQINLEDESRETLVKNLQAGQYISSDDGHLMAYQSEGGPSDATQITVLNFKSGKKNVVDGSEGECLKPLGFVRNDFVYGAAFQADAGHTIAGETVMPMYRLEIRDSKNEIVKTYQAEQIYTLDVQIENNLITLHRVMKEGELYTGIAHDYITNNEKQAESNVTLQSINTELKQTQMCLIYEDGIKDKDPKLLKPKQVIFENPPVMKFEAENSGNKFYVYGQGHLMGTYDKAGYAVQKADLISGVVVSGSQAYVWERGNRYLRFDDEIAPFGVPEGGTSMSACLDQILIGEGAQVNSAAELAEGKSPLDILNEYIDGEALDLTGCKTDQVLYVVGKGRPVIAMLDRENAVLLVGYDTASVIYINPATGARQSVPTAQMDEMTAASGNTFIGYVK